MNITPLIPVVVGAALAGAFGLLGAWIQGRREHSKWLREKRYEAFVDAQRMIDGLLAFSRENPEQGVGRMRSLIADAVGSKDEHIAEARRMVDRAEEHIRRSTEIIAPINLLGPDEVGGALTRILAEALSDDEAKISAASKAARLAMRKALKIRT